MTASPTTPIDDEGRRREQAKRQFMDWFLDNYPANCFLSRPVWHAPKIYRAAEAAIDDAGLFVPSATPSETALPSNERITYRGFSYGVGSAEGIASLRLAIKENGD